MVNKSHIERPIFNFEIFSRDLIEILCGQLSGCTRHMTVSPVESAVTVRGNSSEVNHNLESDRFNSSSVYLSDISTNFNGSLTISNYCALWSSCKFSFFLWNSKFLTENGHFLTQKWTWGKARARWNLAVHAKLAPKERENVPEMSDKSPTAPKNQKKVRKIKTTRKTRHKTSLTLIIFDLQNDLRLKLNLRSGFSGRSKNAMSRWLKHFRSSRLENMDSFSVRSGQPCFGFSNYEIIQNAWPATWCWILILNYSV